MIGFREIPIYAMGVSLASGTAAAKQTLPNSVGQVPCFRESGGRDPIRDPRRSCRWSNRTV
jgi:hypothetical protein